MSTPQVFPIGLSNGPPPGSKSTSGRDALEEIAANGINFVRLGLEDWSLEALDGQITAQRKVHDAIHAHGLKSWLWLGNTPNFPARAAGQPPSAHEAALTRIVTAFRGHPALFAYKGLDEPRNPHRGADWVRPDGLVRAYKALKQLDPNHPVVIVQAPLSTVAELTPYRPAFDITGVDIYPISYPPGLHAEGQSLDIDVVGQLARKTHEVAGTKPFWMTLQIAWSGVTPTTTNPQRVPRFPDLLQERFMAYEAIVNGARGLVFFGGHITAVMRPEDAATGWNWTFWRRVLRPVVSELASAELRPALLAPSEAPAVATKPHSPDIELVTRRTATHLYLIAVRTGGPVSVIHFAGLPKRRNGQPITQAEVLFEPVQHPPPPPTLAGHQVPRTIPVTGGGFGDWFAAHDAHVYRFAL